MKLKANMPLGLSVISADFNSLGLTEHYSVFTE